MSNNSLPWTVFGAFVLLLTQGCGTLWNHGIPQKPGDPRVYRGTRYDAQCIRQAIAPTAKDETHDDPELRTLFLIAMPIDLPLSFVADTILLPYDLSTLDDLP
jgi:uncharacterized protein YceK